MEGRGGEADGAAMPVGLSQPTHSADGGYVPVPARGWGWVGEGAGRKDSSSRRQHGRKRRAGCGALPVRLSPRPGAYV